MNLTKLSLLTIAVLGIAGATGCTKTIKETQSRIDAAAVETEKAVKHVGERVLPRTEKEVVTSNKGAWLPMKSVKLKEELDPRLLRNFTMNRNLSGIEEVAERIVAISSIPAIVTDGLKAEAESQLQKEGDAVDGMTGGPVTDGSVNMMGGDDSYYVSYDGTLAGFLDTVSTRYGVSWEFTDGVIEFYKYKTKMFIVKTVPGSVTANASVKPSSSEEQASQNSTEVNITDVNMWIDISESIESMLSEGGRAVVAQALGTVTVTDTPRSLKMIEEFIDQQNKHLMKQVVVNVQVYSVKLSNKDNYGINWAVVNESLTSSLGLSWEGGAPLSSAGSALTLKKFSTGDVLKSGETVSTKSKWQGSEAFVDALSTQGDVSSVTSSTAVTLNNQPVPVHVGKSTTYLASSTTTPSTTAGVPPTTTIEAGTVTTGFTLNVFPHILDKEELILQYALDLSSLTSLGVIASGGARIQTPEVETIQMLQRVKLLSGETLVLSGYEGIQDQTDKSGTGDASNWLLGGSTSADASKAVIVILVTPTILGDES